LSDLATLPPVKARLKLPSQTLAEVGLFDDALMQCREGRNNGRVMLPEILLKEGIMFLGREQIHHPDYSILEKAYIAVFGIPVVGLRIRARNIFSFIPSGRSYRHILDAGSGPGVLSFELERRFPNALVIGVDLLKDSIAACEHIASKLNMTRLQFEQVAIEQLPQKDFFGLTICVDILEHIRDDVAALNALYRATAPGGILVLHVPAMYRRYPVWQKCLNFDVESHVRVGYEPHDIVEKVKQAGFKIHQSGFTYGFWETLANNLSYMVTRARRQNKILYSLVFPVLWCMSLLGARARPQKLGAGVFVVAEKKLNELKEISSPLA
jgi:2-polyprenyl-3-methyl-5-hydroxy-6-metoxy-1,4-benzoquinol methylase